MSSLRVGHYCIFLTAALCLSLSTLTAKAGLDVFEIYLNNKLLLKMAAGKAFTMETLSLNKSNYNDQLVIYYSQCNAGGKVGKDRSITVKDVKGNILKEWKFADAGGINVSGADAMSVRAAMTIPVKELLQLAKDHPGEALTFYYTAQGRADGQTLAAYHITAVPAALPISKV